MTSLLAELLNAAAMPQIDGHICERFGRVRRDYLTDCWREVASFPGVRYVISLLPESTRRSLTGKGDIFVLFSHVFWVAGKICRHFKAKPAEHTRLVRFLSLSPEFPGILMVFLVFDTLVFQNDFFMALLDEKLLTNWKKFVEVMWETMDQDEELCTEVAKYERFKVVLADRTAPT
jgi:hypothetical protein